MTSNPMRIGLYTPAWPGSNTPNGVTTAVYNLAQGLRQIGHQPIIIARTIDAPLPEGVPVSEVRPNWTLLDRIKQRLGVKDFTQAVNARAIAEACKRAQRDHGLDAVIIEETHGWAGAIQAALTAPVFVTLHGPWLLLNTLQTQGDPAADSRRIAREAHACRRVAGLMAPSKVVMSSMMSEYPDLKQRPNRIIRNSIASMASRSETPQENALLFVGRFDLTKGADILLDAFAQFADQISETKLTFVGPDNGIPQDDGSTQYIEDKLATLSQEVRDRIQVLGRQDRDSVAALRRSHPISITASRYENLNYTMLEALAAGQALISTATKGPSEVLRDDENALVVPIEDADALAQAMIRLCSDETLQDRLRQAGMEMIAEDFSPEAVAQSTVDFIHLALKDQSHS